MSQLSQFLGGGGGGTILETIVLTTSQTWTPPFNGTARIHVIGAGASGASSGGFNDSGAAGGYCRKDVTLSTGTNWTVVVGAGGVGTQNQNIQAGGNSSATDGSSTLTANGAGTSKYSPGTASGGDVNYTGGEGGRGSYSGGGAVSIHSNSSGNASNYSGGATSDAGVDGFIPLGLGQLVGGRGGNLGLSSSQGGFLSGGGAQLSMNSYVMASGGDGGIGAGGGCAINSNNAAYRIGGRGGDGIVIIQYLTVS